VSSQARAVPGRRLGGVPPSPIRLGLLLLALAACTGPPAARPSAPTTTPSSRAQAADDRRPAARAVPRASPPVRIEIPSIGVAAAVVRLGLNRDGTMQVPDEFRLTGWFTGGPAPGETGPAVIAGHVDSRSGPAVFYRLGDLRPGDDITVERADGTAVHFTVDTIARYPKRAFPTPAVFGPTPEPLLHLITCGGSFDRLRRSYRDNVVVTARWAPSAG
jgi:hypothetical protein